MTTTWTKGQGVRPLLGRCCPECGAFILGSDKTVGKRVRWRRCKACNTYMKHVSDDLEAKAFIVAVL